MLAGVISNVVVILSRRLPKSQRFRKSNIIFR